MSVFDRYMMGQIALTLIIVSVTLTLLILLTQSLKFLEVIISSGASAGSFLMLMGLAIPKFAEAVLPVSMMIAVMFITHKMIADSEMIIARAAGSSPLMLARPALVLAGVTAVMLTILSAWVTPKAIAALEANRQEIQAEYASLLFREGVFNTVGTGLNAYIRKRSWNGEMEGLIIHDTRPVKNGENAYTLMAKRGMAMRSNQGQKIIVYDGVRQEFDKSTRNVSRLEFSQYVIDIPLSQTPLRARWREPEERTLPELFDWDRQNKSDRYYLDNIMAEIHRRLSTPLLMMAFTVIGLCALLLGPLNRRGMAVRVAIGVAGGLVLQSLYLLMMNLAKGSFFYTTALYLLPLIPIVIGLFMLSPAGDEWRRSVFFGQRRSS